MTYTDKMKLAIYIAEYIQEELDRGVQPDEVNAFLIADAIEAFEGGAGDE